MINPRAMTLDGVRYRLANGYRAGNGLPRGPVSRLGLAKDDVAYLLSLLPAPTSACYRCRKAGHGQCGCSVRR